MKSLGSTENFTLPSGPAFPEAEEGELYMLDGHATLTDGLYIYVKGKWISSAVLLANLGQGQIFPSYDDPTRADKSLSVGVVPYHFGHTSIKDKTWLGTSTGVGATSGYIMPVKGTIVYLTGQAQDGNTADLQLSLYVNGTEHSNIVNLVGTGGGTTVAETNIGLDIDFEAGDKIQARTHGDPGGPMEDATVMVYVRWRV